MQMSNLHVTAHKYSSHVNYNGIERHQKHENKNLVCIRRITLETRQLTPEIIILIKINFKA